MKPNRARLVDGARSQHETSSGVTWHGAAIRTVQELMGHDSIETTQIYLHCMRKPGLGVKSPFDARGQWSTPKAPST